MRTIYQVDIQCGNCGKIVQADPPDRRWMFAGIGALLLGLFGLLIGLSVGVATAGFGAVAAIFTVPLGLYGGYKTGRWSAVKRDPPGCPKCGNEFGESRLPF